MAYEDSEGYLSVDYIELVPVMIEAIKELRGELLSLKATKSALIPNEVDNMRGGVIVEQNAPNPFNSAASIRFEVPDKIKEAKLYVYNMSGTQIKSELIDQRGKGSIKLEVGELKPGIYLYTIVGDGQQVEVKRMIITK